MIPHGASALRMLAQRMMASVLPDLKSTYAMSDGAMIGMLLTAMADEVESGVANRMIDIEAMKAILGRHGDQVENSDELLSLVPASMHLTDVNVAHDILTRALIALHERVDVEHPSEAQARLNREIFTYLHEHAERHKLSI